MEGDGAEAVVATEHGAGGVFHPAVIEVAAATGEFLNKWLQGFPCLGAEALGTLGIATYPRLPLDDVTGIVERVLVKGYKVVISGDSCGSYLNIFHDRIGLAGAC